MTATPLIGDIAKQILGSAAPISSLSAQRRRKIEARLAIYPASADPRSALFFLLANPASHGESLRLDPEAVCRARSAGTPPRR